MATAHETRGFVPTARHEVGIEHAAEHVYEAGQALLTRRLELWAAEARLFARSGIGFGFAVVFGLAGWFYFFAGVINAFARDYPRFAVEMSVGGIHVAAAAALWWFSRRGTEKLGGPA